MKPTSEERREVARRLRDEGLYASLMPRDQFFRWMFNVVDSPKTVASMTMHLADLIEPAPERTRRFEHDEGELRCSSCSSCISCSGFVTQHSIDEEYFITELTAEMFEYCPFCGAKVVE